MKQEADDEAERPVTMDDAVARALAIGPESSPAERTIGITTVGRRSGIPRRIEVFDDWFARSPLVEIVFDHERNASTGEA